MTPLFRVFPAVVPADKESTLLQVQIRASVLLMR